MVCASTWNVYLHLIAHKKISWRFSEGEVDVGKVVTFNRYVYKQFLDFLVMNYQLLVKMHDSRIYLFICFTYWRFYFIWLSFFLLFSFPASKLSKVKEVAPSFIVIRVSMLSNNNVFSPYSRFSVMPYGLSLCIIIIIFHYRFLLVTEAFISKGLALSNYIESLKMELVWRFFMFIFF